eukprot:gene12152-25503_t
MNTNNEEERVSNEIVASSFSFCLHLNNARLTRFPDKLLQNNILSKIRRLDLSYNNIKTIPKEINKLINLRELWLQHNPIEHLPPQICECSFLEVLDLNSTSLIDLPPELATIKPLQEIDWRNTPMAGTYLEQHKVLPCDMEGLMAVCEYNLLRANLKGELLEMLISEHYVRESDSPGAVSVIQDLVETMAESFPDLEEFKIFVRRANKMLPDKLSMINTKEIERVKLAFHQMNNDTRRQVLSAEVEIKVRCYSNNCNNNNNNDNTYHMNVSMKILT